MGLMEYVLRLNQPGLPISENTARRVGFGSRGGAIAFHGKLAAWKQEAWYAWKQQRTRAVGAVLGQRCRVVVELGFYVHRQRDPHNYIGTVVKSIIDGLVLAGVWPDDTPEWVQIDEPVLVVHSKIPEGHTLPCAVKFYTEEVS